MALWLVRAGKHGEHEARFFGDNRIYLTWDELPEDLSAVKDNKSIRELLMTVKPDAPPGKIANHTGQIGGFLLGMKPGDHLAVPRKGKGAFAVGEITGGYVYDAKAEIPYRHSRTVKWLNLDVPRSAFDQDLLFSLGAIMTICQVNKHNAEARVMALLKKPSGAETVLRDPELERPEGEEFLDLERTAKDQIAKLLIRKFKGHGMARLVEAILKAQGYTTFNSPPGPDKGVDILAAPGALGFGKPRICVQVKSQETPLESRVLNELRGAMQSVRADQGLLVCWGGFKSSIDRERAQHFFDVRLWDQDDLIEQLLQQYERLDEDLRAELPLKRIWTVAAEEPEG
jgi:restriction system protein